MCRFNTPRTPSTGMSQGCHRDVSVFSAISLHYFQPRIRRSVYLQLKAWCITGSRCGLVPNKCCQILPKFKRRWQVFRALPEPAYHPGQQVCFSTHDLPPVRVHASFHTSKMKLVPSNILAISCSCVRHKFQPGSHWSLLSHEFKVCSPVPVCRIILSLLVVSASANYSFVMSCFHCACFVLALP